MRFDYLKLASIVKDVKQNNPQAFGHLYELTYEKLYFLCYSILKNKEDAEDALQEIYIKIYKNIHGLNDEKLFIAWMNRIAYNTCTRILKKRGLEFPGDEFFYSIFDPCENGPEQKALESSMVSYVNSHIDQLDPVLRSMLILKYFEELDLKQIADIVDCPVGTVKSRLHTARRQLKTSMLKDGKGKFLYHLFTALLIKKALAHAAKKTPMKVHAADTVFHEVVSHTALPGTITFTPQGGALPAVSLKNMAIKSVSALGSVVIIGGGLYFSTLPSFTLVTVHAPTDSSYTRETVDITVNTKTPLNAIGQIYMVSENKDDPVYGTLLSENSALLQANANGTYQIHAVDLLNRPFSTTVTVSCIDHEVVRMEEYSYTKDMIVIRLTDSLSGIDYTSLSAKASDGSFLHPSEVDYDSGTLSFAFPDTDFELHVSDLAGNPTVFYIERFIEQP